MKRPRAWVFCLLMLAMGALPTHVFAAYGAQTSPKLLNLFFAYEMTDADVERLAKWDVIVLDMNHPTWFPDKVRRIKELNPKIKILAYVSSSEIAQSRFSEQANAPGRQLADAIPETWFMHRADGSRASWWPGTYLLNATDLGSTAGGQRWNTFLGPFIRDHVLTNSVWDGVFLDSAYSEVTSFFGTDLDPDWNGVANLAKQNDDAYYQGMTKLIKNVRAAIGPDKIIMNNSSAAYASLTNGVLFENFPRGGWARPFAELRQSLAKNPAPKLSAINTNTDGKNTPNDFQLMRFGLTSALVADAYYSFDTTHHATLWYDEYDASIGSPKGAATVVRGPAAGAYPAVWSRRYDNGVVYVNSTVKPEAVALAGEYERLNGAQDPATNSGAVVNKVTVPPQDGVILTRRADAAELKGAAFANGQFLQVYDDKGARLRNGFFASRDDVPGGANVLVADVDRDGSDDVVSSANGQVTVRFGRGGSATFFPFGKTYHGGIELAAGQANRDAAWELIMTPSAGRFATVLITNLRGAVLRSWLAYRKEFVGGASVAIGDFDGDGLREIATGPGKGGGPHIRTFKTDGAMWSGGYFAFDQGETGGANVAVGDVDGDGKDELVVGSGSGSLPRIRVYDDRNRLQSEFALGAAVSPVGVKPVVADIDSDGKAEILVPGSPF